MTKKIRRYWLTPVAQIPPQLGAVTVIAPSSDDIETFRTAKPKPPKGAVRAVFKLTMRPYEPGDLLGAMDLFTDQEAFRAFRASGYTELPILNDDDLGASLMTYSEMGERDEYAKLSQNRARLT